MSVGDLVKADSHLSVHGGKVGIIIFVQPGTHCISAEVLFNTGAVLMRLDNLRLINESR
jgi:hypothetical protein